MNRLRLSYGLLAVVVVVTMAVGFRPAADLTTDQRVQKISETIRCPVCSGETVSESNAPASQLMRDEIAAMVTEGRSDREVRDFFARSYGDDVLLRPRSDGFAGLVWVIPVAGVIGGGAVLAVAFRRWRRWAA